MIVRFLFRHQTFFILSLLFLCPKPASAIIIGFGKAGKIEYNLKTGTFNVVNGAKPLLLRAFSQAEYQKKLFSSKDYKEITYRKQAVKDGFGNGFKHIFLLKQTGLPEMLQVFYTYSGKDYFMMNLILNGADLSINHIVPLFGNLIDQEHANVPVSLFVPFDNDTFISYNTVPLIANVSNPSAEVTALYHDQSRKGLVIGSIEHSNWKTGVITTMDSDKKISIKTICGYTEQSITRDKIAHGYLKGNSVSSAKVFFGAFDDWRWGMETYAKLNRISEPPIIFNWNNATPVGWNSWGAMQEKITLEKANQVSDFFADSLKSFRSGGVAYIDLDSYWDNLLKGGLVGDYSKLKAFADHTKSKGLKPGIYWAPFVDWGFAGGGNRKAEGTDYTFGELWTKVSTGYHDIDGARALDPTHPGTRQRIATVINKFKECGFEMIKIDFLGHAAIESDHFFDPKITTGMQAYKTGMEFLLKQLDGKMLVYAAISPNLASGRYVHVRRIACDAFKSIKDTEYTLNSVSNGWWQSYLYDYIDADHVVFSDQSDGENTARFLSAIVTGTCITGDDFSREGKWTSTAQRLLNQTEILKILEDGKAFVPVEGNKGKSASQLFVKDLGSVKYLAAFNYGEEAKYLTVDFSRIGLKANKQYHAQNLINQKTAAFKNNQTINLAGKDALILKIMPEK
ncbi:alpha-galactosidase [Pedobacter zeae]|uniref:Alpha-galactosidase n=1 Tax=Pedobacter zeae TaxID=1737356 RepID=A0A7W6K8N4_9SPHI|nr:alpha-galactosidase [Pedobacter zeae]MBB4107233.1 alpha-galactosidase [Pedobacter zeae]GGH06542.1 alpha-galactosidase [Pedobacter zeae]